MALQSILEGVHEIYCNSKTEEEGSKTSIPRAYSFSKLLPQVLVSRLLPEVIEMHTTQAPVENMRENEAFDVLFGEEEEDNDSFPFLGFGQYGEPTVQMPTLTRSSNKNNQAPSSNKDAGEVVPSMEKIGESLTTPVENKVKKTVARKMKAVKRKKPKQVTYKKNYVGPQVKENAARSVMHEERREDDPNIPSRSIQEPPQPSEHLPMELYDNIDLQLMSIKDEIDDNDITIENEELFDCPPFNVMERMLSPSSERLHGLPSEHPLDSLPSHMNNNFSSPSKNANGFVSKGNPNTIANGFSRPNDLTELTTQLLELNNKNTELDKKLAKIKQEYETKVTKIQSEKRTNERKIEQTLRKIQNWRDGSDESSIDSSLTSLNRTAGVSSLDKDFQWATKRGTSTKRGNKKAPKKVTKNKPSGKTPTTGEATAESSRSSCHDPEPMVSANDMYGEVLQYEDSGSVDSIDAEIVCLSELYGPSKSNYSDLDGMSKRLSEQNSKASKVQPKIKTSLSNLEMKNISSFKPVVKLSDIYAHKKMNAEEKIPFVDVKCGSYIVIRLSSKKTVKHYCALVRHKTDSGDCFVQYMERKNDKEFIFPEKETMYKIEDSDVVKVLQEPSVKVVGLRLYYSFPDKLDGIKSLT